MIYFDIKCSCKKEFSCCALRYYFNQIQWTIRTVHTFISKWQHCFSRINALTGNLMYYWFLSRGILSRTSTVSSPPSDTRDIMVILGHPSIWWSSCYPFVKFPSIIFGMPRSNILKVGMIMNGTIFTQWNVCTFVAFDNYIENTWQRCSQFKCNYVYCPLRDGLL